MRVMGATRLKLFGLILVEGLWIAVLGYIIGIALSHLSVSYLSGYMQDAYRYSLTGWIFLKEEWVLLLGCLLVGLVSALIPAYQAFRTDISETLGEG
jgi:putative ABC transport system permease protein